MQLLGGPARGECSRAPRLRPLSQTVVRPGGHRVRAPGAGSRPGGHVPLLPRRPRNAQYLLVFLDGLTPCWVPQGFQGFQAFGDESPKTPPGTCHS